MPANQAVKDTINDLEFREQILKSGVLRRKPPKKQDEIVIRSMRCELEKAKSECRAIIAVEPVEKTAAFACRNHSEHACDCLILRFEITGPIPRPRLHFTRLMQTSVGQITDRSRHIVFRSAVEPGKIVGLFPRCLRANLKPGTCCRMRGLRRWRASARWNCGATFGFRRSGPRGKGAKEERLITSIGLLKPL